jgi:putative redox protein
MATETKVQASIWRETYKTQINIREHQLIGDETMENGGKDLGPTPSEFVLAGFATCTASTLRMYADRKGWPVEQIFVELTLIKEKTNEGLVSNISRSIRIEGNIDDEQKQRMIEIAEKCPVHRMLISAIHIKTQIIS